MLATKEVRSKVISQEINQNRTESINSLNFEHAGNEEDCPKVISLKIKRNRTESINWQNFGRGAVARERTDRRNGGYMENGARGP